MSYKEQACSLSARRSILVGFRTKVCGLKSLSATSACTTESCEEDPLKWTAACKINISVANWGGVWGSWQR